MRPVADGEPRPSSFEISAAGAGALEGSDVRRYLSADASHGDRNTKHCQLSLSLAYLDLDERQASSPEKHRICYSTRKHDLAHVFGLECVVLCFCMLVHRIRKDSFGRYCEQGGYRMVQ